MIEIFFSTLKIERFHRRYFSSRDGARDDIFDYVERFYNPIRRHATLGKVIVRSPSNSRPHMEGQWHSRYSLSTEFGAAHSISNFLTPFLRKC